MRDSTKLRLWLCLCTVAMTSCSRSVSPVAPPLINGASALASRDDRAGHSHHPFLVRLHFVGPVATLDRDFETHVRRHVDFFVYSDGTLPQLGAPLDTVPADAELKDVRWRWVRHHDGDPSDEFEAAPAVLASSAHDDGRGATFAPGVQTIVLQAPHRAGGGRVVVQFMVDFPPEAVWWAGPDPVFFPRSSDGDGRAVDVASWANFTTSPVWPPDGRRYFGPDSFRFVPSVRRPVHDDFDRRTFYELFGDRIYARSEGDTVHTGAWVVFSLGGFDRDSRYVPRVAGPAPTLPPGFESRPDLYPVLIAQGLIGSPIGFRHAVPTRDLDGRLLIPSETTLYPDFNTASVFYDPVVAGYWRVDIPGKAYAIALAQDAEGFVSRPLQDMVQLTDRVDAGGGTAAERSLRRRVLTFFVRAAGTRQAGQDAWPIGAVSRAAGRRGQANGSGRCAVGRGPDPKTVGFVRRRC